VCYRKMLKISYYYKERISNVEELERKRETIAFCNIIAKQKMAFTGRVLRGSALNLLAGKMDSKSAWKIQADTD